MRRRQLRSFGLSLAAVLVLAATAPASAMASFGTLSHRVHGPVDARVDGQTTVSASCPQNSHVLSGGQYVRAGVRNATVHSSAPFDGSDADTFPDDGWRSRIDSFNGAHNTVTEYAICSTTQPWYRKDGRAIGEGPYYGNVQTKCPRRKTALGGGIDISPGYGSSAVLISTPNPPAPTGSWKGMAWVGLTSVPNQRLTGWVICGDAEVTYRTATGELPHDADSGRASAACPAATRLVGGGVRPPVAGKSGGFDIRPTTFGPVDGVDGDLVPDDRWRMEADRWSGQSDLHVEATAICLQ